MAIPIRNVYYLLSYAWNKLEEAQKVEASLSDYDDALNLLARVFISGCGLLFKKGLDKEYQTVTEEYAGIKGKIDFTASLNRNLFLQGRSVCQYDVFEENTLLNQLIKAVNKRITSLKAVDPALKTKAQAYYFRMRNVSDMKLTPNRFSEVRIHRNNSFYDFLLRVGRLITESTTLNEGEGNYQFLDFTRDPKRMAALFEAFVRNFYSKEQSQFKVSREDIAWGAQPLINSNASLLPKMQTDITLKSLDRKIIIDTKFYAETLASHFGATKFHSPNLYQLFAYLKNLEEVQADPLNLTCEGILLYPTVQSEIDESFLMGTHLVRMITLDLGKPWREIHQKLLNIIGDSETLTT